MVSEGVGRATLPGAPCEFSGLSKDAAAQLHEGDGDDDFDDCRYGLTQE